MWPQFRQMLDAASSDDAPFEEILVWEFSRFTRKREGASRGFWVSPYAPYGYQKVQVADGARKRPRLALNPPADAVVRRIFESEFLRTSEITETRAFVRSFVKAILVRPRQGHNPLHDTDTRGQSHREGGRSRGRPSSSGSGRSSLKLVGAANMAMPSEPRLTGTEYFRLLSLPGLLGADCSNTPRWAYT